MKDKNNHKMGSSKNLWHEWLFILDLIGPSWGSGLFQIYFK